MRKTITTVPKENKAKGDSNNADYERKKRN